MSVKTIEAQEPSRGSDGVLPSEASSRGEQKFQQYLLNEFAASITSANHSARLKEFFQMAAEKAEGKENMLPNVEPNEARKMLTAHYFSKLYVRYIKQLLIREYFSHFYSRFNRNPNLAKPIFKDLIHANGNVDTQDVERLRGMFIELVCNVSDRIISRFSINPEKTNYVSRGILAVLQDEPFTFSATELKNTVGHYVEAWSSNGAGMNSNGSSTPNKANSHEDAENNPVHNPGEEKLARSELVQEKAELRPEPASDNPGLNKKLQETPTAAAVEAAGNQKTAQAELNIKPEDEKPDLGNYRQKMVALENGKVKYVAEIDFRRQPWLRKGKEAQEPQSKLLPESNPHISPEEWYRKLYSRFPVLRRFIEQPEADHSISRETGELLAKLAINTGEVKKSVLNEKTAYFEAARRIVLENPESPFYLGKIVADKNMPPELVHALFNQLVQHDGSKANEISPRIDSKSLDQGGEHQYYLNPEWEVASRIVYVLQEVIEETVLHIVLNLHFGVSSFDELKNEYPDQLWSREGGLQREKMENKLKGPEDNFNYLFGFYYHIPKAILRKIAIMRAKGPEKFWLIIDRYTSRISETKPSLYHDEKAIEESADQLRGRLLSMIPQDDRELLEARGHDFTTNDGFRLSGEELDKFYV